VALFAVPSRALVAYYLARKPEANYRTYTNTYRAKNNAIDLRHYTSIYLVDDGSLETDSSMPSKGN
jgi:hypothetical protein